MTTQTRANSTPHRPIRRLFIANRGEILRRIATTAKRLGITSVALSDRSPPPAYLLGIVDEFLPVELEAPALYLDAAQLIKLALAAGCDAVHPGFGFLSENAGFAAAVQEAGLVWVGPCTKSIEAMASKGIARGYAERAGVPCVKGLNDFPVPETAEGDFAQLERFAQEAGFPLLIKAAYGGGGKGMRVVNQTSELREAALRARSEAINSFGHGALICEQYLTTPRHVEVQILADKHGQVLAVGDRDCSVQRRHQKIIEEAPAPNLHPETRAAMHAAAVSLAAEVGYDSTGTVEFLVDWSPAARTQVQKFYFLEMNTRLQVEHPVTEEVFGFDLVEAQLRVAMGEHLPDYTHTAVAQGPRGHSVEVRIYAEDVRQGFFPAPGPVAAFRPATGPGIRWEIGLDEMDTVTGRFDPMIAKLIATAATRPAALARLSEALRRSFFAGPEANLEFLNYLITRTEFQAGPVTTHFLSPERVQECIADIDKQRATHAPEAEALLQLLETNTIGGDAMTPSRIDHTSITNFAFGSATGQSQAQQPHTINPASTSVALTSTWQTSSDKTSQAQVGQGLRSKHSGEQNSPPGGKPTAFWYAALKAGSSRYFWVALDGHHFARQLTKASTEQTAGTSDNGDIKAPVPGRVIAIKVKAGDRVAIGQAVFVLESMKMEFEVKATRAGSIREVLVSSGDQVKAGVMLAHWLES